MAEGSTFVNRAALGIDIEPHEKSRNNRGHEERMRAIEARVRAFYESPAGLIEEGCETVLGFMPPERKAAMSAAASKRATDRQATRVAKGHTGR